MNLWHVAWNYLWNRKLTTILTVGSVALGVALIATVLTLQGETKRQFEDQGKVFDEVAGAKGSPLQLVLSSVYFLDIPTGNIRLRDYETLKKDRDVAAAYPFNLGDTYDFFRIVGTTPDIINYKWTDAEGRVRKPFVLAQGRFFKKPMEAVLGSVVAHQTGLKIGDQFRGTHGLYGEVHKLPYTVVGILAPGGTPMDRGIFTSLDSTYQLHKKQWAQQAANEEHAGLMGFATVGGNIQLSKNGKPLLTQRMKPGKGGGLDWDLPASVTKTPGYSVRVTPPVENHGKEVTAVVMALHSPGLQFQFQDRINKHMNVMVASPIREIAKFYQQFLGTAQTVMLSVGFLVIVISALSIMIGLYLSIYQRKRDLAIMRALGASSIEIVGAVIIEAFWVTLLGIVAGWFLGAFVSWAIGIYLARNYGLVIDPFATSGVVLNAFATVALMGLLAGVLPAIQAYRTDVARDLAAV